MRVAAIVLAFVLLTAPARAAVQFYGLIAETYPGGTNLSWSSDLGPQPSCGLAQRFTGQNDFVDSCSNYSPVTSGDAGSWQRVTVAPAGLASAAAPVVTIQIHNWASSANDYYGRFGNAWGRFALYLGPTVPEGGSKYYAVRWHSERTGNVHYATWGAYLSGFWYPVLIANETSGTDGVSYGEVVSPFDPLQVVYESKGGLGAGMGTVVDENVTLEFFVDSQPLADVVSTVAPAALEFAAPWPNPSQGPRTFAFALPARGEVSVRIVDVAGRLVRELRPGELEAGRHELAWDGRAHDGARLGAGVYWAQLSCAGATGTSSSRRRIVVLK